MAIKVLSFDFDGCIFHRTYCYAEEKDVILHNQDFLELIQEEIKALAAIQVIAFVGSNRQSFSVDFMNSGGKGSCFPAMQKISKHLDVTLDTFLLADIYGKREDGNSFALAMSALESGDIFKNSSEHAEWKPDETKMSILYAQMHRVASQYPSEEIIFDFYDDKDKILDSLYSFYEQYKELIPSNVTLRLNQYAGEQVLEMDELHGTGFIDQNYRETVLQIGEIATEHFSSRLKNKSSFDYGVPMHECITPEKLTRRELLSVEKNMSKNEELDEGIGMEEDSSKEDTSDLEINLSESMSLLFFKKPDILSFEKQAAISLIDSANI